MGLQSSLMEKPKQETQEDHAAEKKMLNREERWVC